MQLQETATGDTGLSPAKDPGCREGPVVQWILSEILEAARDTKLGVAPPSGAKGLLTIDCCCGRVSPS